MTDRPTVTGILEAALYVEQVARSMDFYRDLFGFEEELRVDAIGVLRVPGRQASILFPRTIAQAPATTPPLVYNVPLNNALAAAVPNDPGAAELWTSYLRRWTMWNRVRAAAATAALIAYVLALRAAR